MNEDKEERKKCSGGHEYVMLSIYMFVRVCVHRTFKMHAAEKVKTNTTS